MSNLLHKLTNLKPKRAARVLEIVRNCEELDHLVWRFLFKREVTTETIKQGIAQLFPYLCDAEDLKKVGIDVSSDRPGELYLGDGERQQQFEKLLNVPINEVWFYGNINKGLNASDYEEIIKEGLKDVTARVPSNKDRTPELHMWGWPKEYTMDVADNKFSPESAPCCLRLYELLHDV